MSAMRAPPPLHRHQHGTDEPLYFAGLPLAAPHPSDEAATPSSPGAQFVVIGAASDPLLPDAATSAAQAWHSLDEVLEQADVQQLDNSGCADDGSAAPCYFLGYHDSTPLFVVDGAAAGSPAVQPSRPRDLRTLAMSAAMGYSDASILGRAVSMVHFHRTHTFCARCGGRTVAAPSGDHRACGGATAQLGAGCGAQLFPRVDPVVITAVTQGSGDDQQLLLGRQARFPPGMYERMGHGCQATPPNQLSCDAAGTPC